MALSAMEADMELRYRTSTPPDSLSPDTQLLLHNIQRNIPEALAFHKSLPGCEATPLHDLGVMPGIGRVFLKDEGHRLGLKAFKGLGGTFAVHKLKGTGVLKPGDTLTTMTDGNHGVGVAYAAKQGGYKAVIYIPQCMKQDRRDRITGQGGELVEVAGPYDEAVAAARRAAEQPGWHLVADSSWDGYEEIPTYITTAYSTLFNEAIQEMREKYDISPTHMFLQTGVGSFAAGGIAYALSANMEPVPRFICVEPCDAACILENIEENTDGTKLCRGATESVMAGLNCGTPAKTAWPLLRDCCSAFLTLGDGWPIAAVRELHEQKIVAGESGCAGYAALIAARQNENLRQDLQLSDQAVILLINTEGATDAVLYNQIIGKQTT